jgi:hypothetical protein
MALRMAELIMCIFAVSICNACFVCPAIEFFMISNGGWLVSKTAGFSHAGSLPAAWLGAVPETGLPATIQHLAAGDRRANSDPATLDDELAMFPSYEPTPRARHAQSEA